MAAAATNEVHVTFSTYSNAQTRFHDNTRGQICNTNTIETVCNTKHRRIEMNDVTSVRARDALRWGKKSILFDFAQNGPCDVIRTTGRRRLQRHSQEELYRDRAIRSAMAAMMR
jgi:hypothetical protein